MAAWRHRPCAGLLAVVLLGCSGGGPDVEPAVSPADDSDEVAGSPSPVPLTPTPVDEAAVAVVPLAERPHRRVRIVGGPDWLATGAGRVFVKLDRNDVAELDRDTGEVVRSFGEPGELCQGLGAAFGSIWVCAGPDVVRIDPTSGAVIATIPVNKTFEQGHLVAGFGRVWVLRGTGGELAAIDPETNQIGEPIALGARGHDLATGPGGVWVVSGPDHQVLRVDPDRGQVALRVEGIRDPRAAWVGEHVWVAASAGVFRLSRDGEVLGSFGLPLGRELGLSGDEREVWLRSARGFLHRFDAVSGELLERISADVTSSGAVLVTPQAVWTSAFDDGVVFRLERG